MEKLRQGRSCVTPEDTTVLLGDVSWALGLDAAGEDFAFISELASFVAIYINIL